MGNKGIKSDFKVTSFLDVVGIILMGLMFISTVINILYLKSLLSVEHVQFGFIVVILWGILMNYFIMKEKNSKKEKVVELRTKRNTLAISTVVIISLAWVVSYFYTKFK